MAGRQGGKRRNIEVVRPHSNRKPRRAAKSGQAPATEFLSRSPAETHRLGFELAANLTIPGVLLLRGSLGTGKTTLTRGVAEGLGLEDGSRVNSPSFTLVNVYHGRCPIYHVDLYRLAGKRDLGSIGLDEFLGRDGVTVVEWSERLDYRPELALEVELEDAGDDLRLIRIRFPEPVCRPHGARHIDRRHGRKSAARIHSKERSKTL